MSALVNLLVVILRAVLPVLALRARDSAGDGQAPGPLEDRLRRKIREDGWHAE